MAAYNFWDCNLSASGHEYNSCKQRNISSVGIYLFTEISPSPMYISQPSGKEFRKGNYCTAENESWVKICKNTYKIRQTAQNNQAKLRSQVGKAQIPLRRLCDKVRDKSTTKSRNCRGHKSWEYAIQITSPTFVICVRDKVRGFCRRLCRQLRGGILK